MDFAAVMMALLFLDCGYSLYKFSNFDYFVWVVAIVFNRSFLLLVVIDAEILLWSIWDETYDCSRD